MRFLVFSDLHYDDIPDGNRRIAELIGFAKGERVEFMLGLGDICHPTKENEKVLDAFRNSSIPAHFVPGNHDTQNWSEEAVLKFWRLEKPYYSVLKDRVKFLFLNAEETPQGPIIPEHQIAWLREELKSDNYFVVLTHQSFSNEFMTSSGKSRAFINRREIRKLLEEANGRVLLCMNGHDHGSMIREINGIPYYAVNSASYVWQSVKEVFPYAPEVHEKYPYLKNLLLYREPLYCIVNIDEPDKAGIVPKVSIEGIEGSYLTVTPEDIGIEYSWNGVSILPHTLSYGEPL